MPFSLKIGTQDFSYTALFVHVVNVSQSDPGLGVFFPYDIMCSSTVHECIGRQMSFG